MKRQIGCNNWSFCIFESSTPQIRPQLIWVGLLDRMLFQVIRLLRTISIVWSANKDTEYLMFLSNYLVNIRQENVFNEYFPSDLNFFRHFCISKILWEKVCLDLHFNLDSRGSLSFLVSLSVLLLWDFANTFASRIGRIALSITEWSWLSDKKELMYKLFGQARKNS